MAGAGDLEDVAGAVVEDGADGAEGRAAGVDDGEADQVGVVELVVGERRQAVARGVEAGALERLGLLAGGDAGEAGGEGAGDGAGDPDAEAAAVLGEERRVAGDGRRVGAEGLQPHLALHAEAAGDGADAGEARIDPSRIRHGRRLTPPAPRRRPRPCRRGPWRARARPCRAGRPWGSSAPSSR